MGNFRATGIGLHSRDSHTLKCSDSALGKNPAIFLMAYVREATVLKFGKLPKEGEGGSFLIQIILLQIFAVISAILEFWKGGGPFPNPKTNFKTKTSS